MQKEFTGDNEAIEATDASNQKTLGKLRVADLKRCSEKFASSVHKFLVLSSQKDRSSLLKGVASVSFGEDGDSRLDSGSKLGDDRSLLKMNLTENSFRMRLCFKMVT
ncbi:hypothetical protein CCR75_004988 [Bremia lactucae]|uniref:Uncharacterized protein n=1 Tax=Bremia lactucae TaxID=4779 RepID=A0A976FQ26_BRELC|nr:hypothetical protein CCR75_004988 [Bremia lactucae]